MHDNSKKLYPVLKNGKGYILCLYTAKKFMEMFSIKTVFQFKMILKNLNFTLLVIFIQKHTVTKSFNSRNLGSEKLTTNDLSFFISAFLTSSSLYLSLSTVLLILLQLMHCYYPELTVIKDMHYVMSLTEVAPPENTRPDLHVKVWTNSYLTIIFQKSELSFCSKHQCTLHPRVRDKAGINRQSLFLDSYSKNTIP